MKRRRFSYPNKFHAVRAEVNGITFHSKREAEHYRELLLMKQAGEIVSEIERQILIRLEVNGHHICNVKPDFRYTLKGATKPTIDETKGFRTADWVIKWKLMQALYSDDYIFVLS